MAYQKEVIIKMVIQAIPTFAMGYFKLPLGPCNEIEALIKKNSFGGSREIKEKYIGYGGMG